MIGLYWILLHIQIEILFGIYIISVVRFRLNGLSFVGAWFGDSRVLLVLFEVIVAELEFGNCLESYSNLNGQPAKTESQNPLKVKIHP